LKNTFDKNSYISVIDGYGYDGEGVARLEGKVVFIPYALRGEKVKFSIKSNQSSFLRGKLIEIQSKSNKRTLPPCPYFTKCGGCNYQHTTYENELGIKKELLKGQLKKVGFEKEIEVIPSSKEYSYRNKIHLFVGEQGLSLKERGSNNLCKIDKCLLISEEMNRAIGIIDSFFAAQTLYDQYSDVIIRQENENLCVIFNRNKTDKQIKYQGLYLILGSHFGIFETIKGMTEFRMGLKYLEASEHNLNCKFLPNSFHQINGEIGKAIYEYVATKVLGKSVANCYSGAGVLSGYLASLNKRVMAIELGESEHQDAERLKEENNLFYLTNLKGDCAEVLPKLEEIDSIIVDPPRAGLDKKVVESINMKGCQRLIYISCNSATLVRDISRLVEYKLSEVKLFDMFARTGEYEVVAILDKIK